jgi:DNA-binding NtrC family response regulator
MPGNDEDDRPTIVLDLNALKQQKLKQEEELTQMAQELEFAVPIEVLPEKILAKNNKVILFDLQSDFFEKSFALFPNTFEYQIVKDLPELNKYLFTKKYHYLILNYDVNPKAIHQLSTQMKKKFPEIKTIIMAKNISPQKAQLHASTPAGAHGYYQFPLETQRIEAELRRLQKSL